MIGQYLSNTNENATVLIFQKNLELNKALATIAYVSFDPLFFKGKILMTIF